jgi:murein DD-endopeptidase MepM/ murein hydrolase activator NlpD
MKFRVSGQYGELAEVRNNIPHKGIDLAMNEGTPIRTIADGVVERVVDLGDKNLGKGIIIRDSEGHRHIFGHLSDFRVRQGEYVREGQLIALSGNTGNSTGAHLHYGLKVDGTFVNPDEAIQKVSQYSGDTQLPEFIAQGDLKEGFLHKFMDNGKVDSFTNVSDTWLQEKAVWLVKTILAPLGHFIDYIAYPTTLFIVPVLVILGVCGYKDGYRKAGLTIGIFALIKGLRGAF